jgi:hypothetical protein
VLFRFGVVYFGLYSLATQIAGGLLHRPGMALLPALGTRWPMRQITEWCAAHVVRRRGSRSWPGNSADTLFHWVQMAWLLAASIAIAARGRGSIAALPIACACGSGCSCGSRSRRRCSITGWRR